MKKSLFFNCLLLVLSLSSCGDMTQDSQTAIEANPTLTTFGATSLSQGQQVWFWADAQSNPVQEDYFKAWLLTSDADGHLSGSTKQHYPKGNQTPIDLYGLHGDFDPGQLQENTTPFPAGEKALKFKIETNQKDGTPGHDLSDLLYGIKKGAAPSKQAIDIDFVHMLSNVSIVLKADANSNLSNEQIQDAVVRIKGVKTTATFTPKKDADPADPDKRLDMLGKVDTPANIDLSTHFVKKEQSDFTGATYGQAILIPQQLSGKWLEVTVAGVTHSYDQAFLFQPGRDYKLNVTVSDILDVQCQVTKWTDGGSGPAASIVLGGIDANRWDDGGSGRVVNNTCRVGDYLYNNNGKWDVSPGAPSDPDKSKGICIGVVFKGGRDAGDNCTYTMKDGQTPMTDFHGYAVALLDGNPDSQQKGQGCLWSTEAVLVGTNISETDFMGYFNTQKIKERSGTGGGLKKSYPACFYATDDYEKNHAAAPDNSSGWFFPSAGQLQYLYDQEGTYISSITKAGGKLWQTENNQLYWSSSENNDKGTAMVANDFSFSSGKVTHNNKSINSFPVRAVIVF